MTDWIQARAFAGKRITVMGLGAFGGQIGAVRFLANQGADVLVTDLKPEAELRKSLEELAALHIRFRLGEHLVEDFTQADMVLPSPAVPPRSEFLQAAAAAGVPIESEMGLFFRYCPAQIVGVTGSNGKSTTTSIIGAMAKRDARRSWLGGNIGGSVLEAVDQIEAGDLVVLELSSFQLESLDRLSMSPHVAVVTNFSPNHLDHHADMAEYRRAKQTILRHQRPGDFAVLNRDDADVRAWRACARASVANFSVNERLEAGAFLDGDMLVWRWPAAGQDLALPRADLAPPGRHNAANALAAMAAAALAGVSADAIGRGIKGFRGLEHRLEFACERGGVRYYNDSKATTPAAGIIGVDAFADAPGGLIVIAGGYDKHVPLDDYAAACVRRAKCVVVLGQVSGELKRLLLEQRGDAAAPVVAEAATFVDGVALAQVAAEPGDVVLLSPACASYDMFHNFEERGRQFKRIVLGS